MNLDEIYQEITQGLVSVGLMRSSYYAVRYATFLTLLWFSVNISETLTVSCAITLGFLTGVAYGSTNEYEKVCALYIMVAMMAYANRTDGLISTVVAACGNTFCCYITD